MQAGVLATALMMGTAGCGNNAGGSTVEPKPGHDDTTPTYQPGECTGDHFQYKYEELGGVQFVGGNEDWTYNYIDKDQEFDKHYQNALDFIYKRIADLQKDLKNKNVDTENNPLYKLIDTALKKDPAKDDEYTEGHITTVINNNYENLAPVIGHIYNQYLDADGVAYDNNARIIYNRYNACYHWLAKDAFNKSVGTVSRKIFETNKEYTEHDYFFNHELARANLGSTQTFTTDMAKENMKVTLGEIANKTSTDSAILQKVVELALYNESLYGLHDFAKSQEVSGYWQYQRDSSNFDHVIATARHNIQNYSLDDRIM